ncbi:flagellar filament capping protein FliD [Bacillus seohaeanensis]|uniref:Flagellar hook-associated protein 2 n=1 Tax=Bacillus seohaeanensis TaxID=284580 RepID=A0ABW5RM23_9BACI
MRIGGLASGMDIDSIVSDLMKAERIPLDKLKQEKQILEWKRDDYREINTLLLDFRSELTEMKYTRNFRARTTSSTDESKVTATASTAASQASYTITEVTQLASAATKVNGSSGNNGTKLSMDDNNKIDPAASLFNETTKFDLGDPDDITNFKWSTGVVEKQTIPVTGDDTVFKLDLTGTTGLKTDDSGNLLPMNVRVNGKLFEVVTSGAAGDNQVLVENDGSLTFGTEIKKESSIEVDYIAKNKTEKRTFEEPIKEFQLAKGSISSLTLTVGTTDYTLAETTDTDGNTNLEDGNGGVIGTINKDTGKITFTNEQAANSTITANYTQNYTNFSLTTHNEDGQLKENFFIQGDDSLNAVIDKVNSSDVGVTMFYDSFADQVSLTRSETGDFNVGGEEITTSGDFINKLLKFDSDPNSTADNATETGGTNVKFEINGLTTERYSNTFEMNGVTFTVKQKFDATDTPNGVSMSVSNDSEKVFENIKGFIEKYNELIDKIKDKTSEEYYRSYKPLTDDQRESLSDKQQEKWEEMAKSGLLRRDPILSSVLSEMRMDFYQPVENVDVSPLFNQLASIGITTTSSYLEGGKLEINEADLKKAIEEDPDSVENLFRGGGDSTVESQQGILHRLFDTVNKTKEKLDEKAGGAFSTNQQFAIGKELSNVDDRIDRFEDRMKQVEDRYWRQFTAMEKAIQQANSQSAYLMQQFSGM